MLHRNNDELSACSVRERNISGADTGGGDRGD